MACECGVVYKVMLYDRNGRRYEGVRCKECGATFDWALYQMIQRGKKVQAPPVKAWGFRKESE